MNHYVKVAVIVCITMAIVSRVAIARQLVLNTAA